MGNEVWIRVRNWLGLERNILVMLSALLILGMGEELWIRFVPKYLEYLGASVWVIAVYGTLKRFLDAVYQYPGGWLADRLGRRASLIFFIILAIIGYLLYLLGPGWKWVMIGTFFVMAWSSLTLPAIFSIIGDSLPRTHRSIGFGVQSILKRVPVVLGPFLGGFIIASAGMASGMKLGFGITIILALIAVFIVLYYYRESVPLFQSNTNFVNIWRNMDTRFKWLLVADCLARWAGGMPEVFVVLYIVNIRGLDIFHFGWLTSIQMLTAILIYIPIAKLSDRMNRKPFVLITFAFFALFPLVLVNATSFFWVVLAFVIAGLREVGEPARKALIVDLAHEAARGRTVGMYYLIRGLAVFPASLAGGWLWTIDNQLPFYSAALVGTAGFLVYMV